MRLFVPPHLLSYIALGALVLLVLLMLLTPARVFAADPSTDPCIALLAPERPVRATPVQAADLSRQRAIPAALFGIMVGAHHATGPRENGVAFVVRKTDTNADRVRAVTAYRRCAAAEALRALSNGA